jgi:hypothetical protein
MALTFPISASIGQTYQSGSSNTYEWTGTYWKIKNVINFNAFSASIVNRVIAATNEQNVTNTNWNKDKEYILRKTEQLTFSGDYILEDCALYIDGGEPNSIGNWIPVNFNGDGSITQTSNNTYRIDGPNDDNGDGWLFIKKYFNTETTMSIDYEWRNTDSGEDWPIYDVSEQEPSEVDIVNRLETSPGANFETGSWTINIPANRWVAIGIYSTDSAAGSGSLSVTLPYLPNEDSVQYSANKYFKKQGSIFIGGNLLVKDSYIENNGLISVGGEVILIGDSQIEGTGIII